MPKLAELRRQLVEKRIELRDLADSLEIIRAGIETGLVERAGGEKKVGENERARERAFLLALDANDEYCQYRVQHNLTLAEIERLEAEIEILRDERREWEWGIRQRLAAALDGKGIDVVEEPETSEDNQTFDALADAEAVARAAETEEAPWAGPDTYELERPATAEELEEIPF